MVFTRERAALLAASTVAFGLASLLRKVSVDRIHPLQYQCVAASVYVALLPLYVLMTIKVVPEGASNIDMRGVFWAVVATALASFGGIMFGYALRSANDVGVMSTLVSLSPILTMMLSFALLGERPSSYSAVGCVLVLAGMALISVRG